MKKIWLFFALLFPMYLLADIPSFEGTNMYVQLLNAEEFPGWTFYYVQEQTDYDPEMGGRYVSGHLDVNLETGKHYLLDEDGNGAYLFAKDEEGNVLQSTQTFGEPEGPYYRNISYTLSKLRITQCGDGKFVLEVDEVVSVLPDGTEKAFRDTKKGAVLDPGLVLPLIAFLGLVFFFVFRRRMGYVVE